MVTDVWVTFLYKGNHFAWEKNKTFYLNNT